jgi:hypothetical protein
MISTDILIWVDAILSIMFISSVWKDNIFSKIAQNIAVGAAIGHGILIAGDTIYRTGILATLGGKVATLVGLILGILMFGRFTRYKWLARYPTQLVMAVGLGVLFGLTITTQIFGQITTTLDAFLKFKTTWDLLAAFIILIGAATTLAYFLFTFPPFAIKQREKGAFGIIRRIGRIFMMSSFGINFAGEEIWYLTMLIGRLWILVKVALGL